MLPKGQILPSTRLGQMLTTLARDSEVIVEIGTWFGQGSTRCLANGLIRPSQRLWTVESHRPMYEEARSSYHDLRIVFLWGSVSPMRDVPIVFDQIPSQVDLLLLDGGEDNGVADFDALWQRSRIIVLDDTHEHCRKNPLNRKRLMEWGWTILADELNDRNGWAVFKKP